jgi:hypothetical protein
MLTGTTTNTLPISLVLVMTPPSGVKRGSRRMLLSALRPQARTVALTMGCPPTASTAGRLRKTPPPPTASS